MNGGEGLVEDEDSLVWVEGAGGGVVVLFVSSGALLRRAEDIIFENFLKRGTEGPQSRL